MPGSATRLISSFHRARLSGVSGKLTVTFSPGPRCHGDSNLRPGLGLLQGGLKTRASKGNPLSG
jgi:hypothetical protein